MNFERIDVMKSIENVKRFYKGARFWLGCASVHGRYPRAFVFDQEKKLVYLTNTKVACTSIKKSIFGEHEDIHAYVRQQQKEMEVLSTDMEEYYKFTFVRNPYKRLGFPALRINA